MADKKFAREDVEGVWSRDSNEPGPTTLILGGVHGNERAGIKVVRKLVSGELDVPLERGRIIVTLGNTAAIKAGVRYKDKNLNRQFRELTPEEAEEELATPSYEAGRARALMPVLDEADFALDLHGFRQRDGQPFIITEPRGFEAARAIGAPIVSSGWTTIEPGGTDGYMEARGRVGLCYELSQLKHVKQGVPRGEKGVLRFLAQMGLIEYAGETEGTQPTYVQAERAVLAKPGFRWGPNSPYRSFQALEPGELIAQNGSNPEDAIYAGSNQVIIFPSDEADPNPEAEMFNLGTIFEPAKS